jgi:hypothetical protein
MSTAVIVRPKASRPAPRRSRRKQIQNASAQIVVAAAPRQRNPPARRSNAATSSAKRSRYISFLTRPFGPFARLGMGTLVPTTLARAYAAGTQPVQSVSGPNDTVVFVAALGPFAAAGMTYAYPGFINSYGIVNPGSTLTANAGTGNFTSYPATNLTAIAAQLQSARVVSASLRVNCRYASTSIAPKMVLIHVYDTLNAILGQSPNALMGFQGARTIYGAGGVLQGEVQYRPNDISDFGMLPAYTTNNANAILPTDVTHYAVIVATGCTFSTTTGTNLTGALDFFRVVNLEGVTGTDQTLGVSPAEEESLDLSVNDVASVARETPSQLHQLTAQDVIDNMLASLSRTARRNGSSFLPLIADGARGLLNGSRTLPPPLDSSSVRSPTPPAVESDVELSSSIHFDRCSLESLRRLARVTQL